MQKSVALFIGLFIFWMTNAQTALIRDLDGYCNIRQYASQQSKVMDTLHNGRIIFVFSDAAEGDWLPIEYYNDNKKISRQSHSGYIHKSRIVFLNELVQFKEVALNDSILRLQLDSIQVTLTKISFSPKGRQIQYEKPQGQQAFIKAINNKFPWGTDGNIPKKEYGIIQFKNGGVPKSFPPSTFKDLFEPNLSMTTAYFDKTSGKIYIEAMNSDAAGAYVVIWAIKDRQILERATFIPF